MNVFDPPRLPPNFEAPRRMMLALRNEWLGIRPLAAILFLALPTIVGCGGASALEQRLVGDWIGRPETAGERLQREWPGGKEEAPTQATAESTDLEAYRDLKVGLMLNRASKAELSINEARVRHGLWKIVPGEGRRATLEISLADEGVQGIGNAEDRELRRFQIELLKEGNRFVLYEEGADLRFGRLVFQRQGMPASEASSSPLADTKAE